MGQPLFVQQRLAREGFGDVTRPKESSIVAKCARIMDVISQARQPLPFSDIVARTGFVKSSCHRVLAVLQAEDMVTYDRQSRMYFTGARLRSWARSSWVRTDVQDVAVPAMDALSEKTGMNAALSIQDDEFILYLRTSDRLSLRLAARAGDRAPLHCTAAGKVFLAYMTEARRMTFLETVKLEKFTERTMTTPAELERDAQNIRARGYGLAIREEYLHVMGMAAPIRDGQGDVSACLSIWTITDDTTPEQLERFAPHLMQAADDISALNGWSTSHVTTI